MSTKNQWISVLLYAPILLLSQHLLLPQNAFEPKHLTDISD